MGQESFNRIYKSFSTLYRPLECFAELRSFDTMCWNFNHFYGRIYLCVEAVFVEENDLARKVIILLFQFVYCFFFWFTETSWHTCYIVSDWRLSPNGLLLRFSIDLRFHFVGTLFWIQTCSSMEFLFILWVLLQSCSENVKCIAMSWTRWLNLLEMFYLLSVLLILVYYYGRTSSWI